MTIEVEDARHTYIVTTTCGRPSGVLLQRKAGGLATPVEWEEVPFLVQTEVEVRIGEGLNGCPQGLWKR